MGKRIRHGLLVLLLVTLAYATAAVAAPIGLENQVTAGTSSTYDDGYNPYTIAAIAGNVTELTIDANWTTNAWQGYYGNVTGTILLANSVGQALYDWSLANPSGEVYASRQNSVSWANIKCADLANMTAEESTAGIGATDVDGVNETFSSATYDLDVGGVSLTNCYGVNLYDNTGAASANFQEVILADTASTVVYASILTSDSNGFDSKTHDFEMIVPENGHNGDTSTTSYYFWAELS